MYTPSVYKMQLFIYFCTPLLSRTMSSVPNGCTMCWPVFLPLLNAAGIQDMLQRWWRLSAAQLLEILLTHFINYKDIFTASSQCLQACWQSHIVFRLYTLTSYMICTFSLILPTHPWQNQQFVLGDWGEPLFFKTQKMLNYMDCDVHCKSFLVFFTDRPGVNPTLCARRKDRDTCDRSGPTSHRWQTFSVAPRLSDTTLSPLQESQSSLIS